MVDNSSVTLENNLALEFELLDCKFEMIGRCEVFETEDNMRRTIASNSTRKLSSVLL